MLREYKEEIARLRGLLEMQAKGLSPAQFAAVAAPSAELASEFEAPSAALPRDGESPRDDTSADAPEAAALSAMAPPGVALPGEASPGAPPGMASPPDMASPPGMAPPPDMAPPPGMAPLPALAAPGMAAAEVRVVEKEVVVERVVEVVPVDHLKQRKALEEYNASVVDQRNRLGEELQEKDGAVRAAQLHRAKIEGKLAELQAKLMHGFGIAPSSAKDGTAAAVADTVAIELARKEREYRRVQAKLRAKRRKEAQLEAEKKEAEAEKKEAEDELKNAREEAETAERRQVRELGVSPVAREACICSCGRTRARDLSSLGPR